MKKICIIFVFSCLTTAFAQAQFMTGQKVIGGNIGFSANKVESPGNYYHSNNSLVSVNPYFATFSKPNLLCGIGLTYSYNHQKDTNLSNNSAQTTNRNNIGIEVF